MTQDLEIHMVKCCTVDGEYYGDGVHDPTVPGDGPWYVQKWVDGDLKTDVGVGTRAEALNLLEQLLPLMHGEEYRLVVDPWK